LLILVLLTLVPSGVSQPPTELHSINSELPAAPNSQLTPGTIAGTITDSDGASISAARISLLRDTQPPPGSPEANVLITTSDSSGHFYFPNIPPGPFRLSITAAGFVPRQISDLLPPGRISNLPAIALTAGSITDVEVTATQTEIAEAQINKEEKQRVLGFIPNFYVSYDSDPVPLDPAQKLELALKTMVDPVSFALNGLAAGIEQADNAYAWGQGAQGYEKRYAADFGTFLTGDILGNAAFPILFKQDPRYFYKGTGTVPARIGYAIANSVICRGDNHHWQPDYSSILGGLAASGISNAYYPAPNRTGIGLTLEGAAIGTGLGAVANVIQEFLVRRLTPHIPPPTR
jgi:hypothetical protein